MRERNPEIVVEAHGKSESERERVKRMRNLWQRGVRLLQEHPTHYNYPGCLGVFKRGKPVPIFKRTFVVGEEGEVGNEVEVKIRPKDLWGDLEANLSRAYVRIIVGNQFYLVIPSPDRKIESIPEDERLARYEELFDVIEAQLVEEE